MIFESHAHYDDRRFDPDRKELLLSMEEHGIETIINVGSDLEGVKKTLALTEEYPFVYGAVGIHPSEIGDLNEEVYEWMRERCSQPKVVAVGEIGLDYYWEKEDEARRNQRYWFCRQMELAREQELPVIIHSREAAEDTLKLVQGIHGEQIPGVIHCFSYSPEQAMEYIRMGYYIGGVITFKNARKLKETAAVIPLEHILLETDCPYLSPEPERGKRNSSLNLPYVAQEIAELRGITSEEVIAAARENARRLFSKVK